MKNSGLTEKKMANKKFRKTENAIFIAYYKFRDYPSAKTLARRAKISRATLYRHHSSPQSLSKDYEKYLLDAYAKKIKKLLKRNPPLKTLFLRTLVFIHNHRLILKALFKEDHKEIIKKMLDKLKDRILKEWNYAGNTDKLYKVYQNEILGIIEAWGKNDFSVKETTSVLSDILYLTKTTPKHLSRFLEQS